MSAWERANTHIFFYDVTSLCEDHWQTAVQELPLPKKWRRYMVIHARSNLPVSTPATPSIALSRSTPPTALTQPIQPTPPSMSTPLCATLQRAHTREKAPAAGDATAGWVSLTQETAI